MFVLFAMQISIPDGKSEKYSDAGCVALLYGGVGLDMGVEE